MALVTGPLAGGTWAADRAPQRSSMVTEDDDTNDTKANNIADDGDDRHPSGKDRSIERGGSGNQGAAAHDPDDDGHGPDRSNGGLDQPDGPGGVDGAPVGPERPPVHREGQASSGSGGRNSNFRSPSRTRVDATHPPIPLNCSSSTLPSASVCSSSATVPS